MIKKAIFLVLIILAAQNFNGIYAQDNEPGPLAAYQQDSLWHFVDSNGNEMFPPKKLVSVYGYSEGLIRATKIIGNEVKWIFLNLNGDPELVLDYDHVLDFSHGYAVVANYKTDAQEEAFFSFVNRSGDLIMPMEYIDATTFTEGLGYRMKENDAAYIDTTGEIAITLHDVVGYPFSEGFAAVNDKNYEVGYINREGELVIDMYWDEPGYFSEGLVDVIKNDKFGYIDTAGNIVIDLQYDEARPFHEGAAFVAELDERYNYHWGLINRADTMIVDFIFDAVQSFSEGYAAVSKDGKWIYINQLGDTQFGRMFDYAGSFKDGLAWASSHSEEKYGFINQKGFWQVELPKAEKYFDMRFNEFVK